MTESDRFTWDEDDIEITPPPPGADEDEPQTFMAQNQPRDAGGRFGPTGGHSGGALTASEQAAALAKLEEITSGITLSHGIVPIGAIGWKHPEQELRMHATREEIAKHAVSIDVKLSDLHPTQDGVFRRRLTSIGSGDSGQSEPGPLVVRSGGRLLVSDGHTRLSLMILAGRKHANVRVIDVDAEGNLAGRD